MEVTALHIGPMMTVLFLLALQVDYSCSETVDAFPRVDPNRQQFFEYESIVISCEGLAGLTGWRVMKKLNGVVQTCSDTWSTSTGPCQIQLALSGVDSGEFWCEMGVKRSNTVNLTVTAGSVILESPVWPVMEEDNVTLSCRMKTSSSDLTALFYKDGVLMDQSPTGIMTISSVSRSYEGLYKCSFSGAGESAESWLGVRAVHEEDPPLPLPLPLPQRVPQLYLLLSIKVAVFLATLSLLVGRLRCWKHQIITTVSVEDQTEELQTRRSVVNTPQKKKKEEGSGVSSCST